MSIILEPIAYVISQRKEISDDYWGEVLSEIHLVPALPDEAFDGIETFSHLQIIFHFSKSQTVVFADHPRGNPEFPRLGIFAQRKKDRPNHLGLTTVQLIERKERMLLVKGLDALDGTPVLDIKPVFREFEPRGEIRQPEWVSELMKLYWK